jgi:hypothetical protein
MLDRARELARLASEAFFYPAEDAFHRCDSPFSGGMPAFVKN